MKINLEQIRLVIHLQALMGQVLQWGTGSDGHIVENDTKENGCTE